MDINLSDSWKLALSDELRKPYFRDLMDQIDAEYAQYICYPPACDWFSAFNLCPFEKIKVVILGQDPYHGQGQAHGLAFSVRDGIKNPPSLQNIFKEVQADVGAGSTENGNLERWASQGVLLLNATLTVRESLPGSHHKMGWELFTDAVIKLISDRCEGVVFLLWGGYARSKSKLIDRTKHLIWSRDIHRH